MVTLLAIDDDVAIRRLGALYAYALDRDEPALLSEVFAPDALWHWGQDRRKGISTIGLIPARLRRAYRSTLHQLTTQLVLVDDAGAVWSETYCTADHLEPDRDVVYSVAIRYRDRLEMTSHGWRITDREVIVEWAHENSVIPSPPPVLPPPDLSYE